MSSNTITGSQPQLADTLLFKIVIKHIFTGEPFEVQINARLHYGVSRAIMFIPLQGDPGVTEDAIQQAQDALLAFSAGVMSLVNGLQEGRQWLVSSLIKHVYGIRIAGQWKDPADPLLYLCYGLLRQHIITRDDAFQFAKELLGDQAPKSSNSWRVRVDEYAKKRHLDPVGQPIRKRRTS